MQEREKSDVGTERGKSDAENAHNNGNGEGTRNRFSIGSFFTKLNRQRFATQICFVMTCFAFSERTSSCPDFLGEKRTPVGAILAEVAVKAPQEDLLERFPYLRLMLKLRQILKVSTRSEEPRTWKRVKYVTRASLL
ncbi:unnamed protein product [Cylicostephanus goldi]|uniref:Uncharacterized protein n=1 Tax=Cylicostephanus goldi TaxID=71465 RepID=A0A3P6QIF1_CYLGO|nr:unnamed protein product [Cylicostephanus goldi]